MAGILSVRSRSRLAGFAKQDDGNFAFAYAIILPLLLLCAGAALDLSQTVQSRLHAQRALDAAILSSAIAGAETEKEYKETILASLGHSAPDLDFGAGHGAKLAVTLTDDQLDGEITARRTTSLMGMFGVKHMTFRVTSSAFLPDVPPLNVALVVDTTASMEGANLTALKGAADKLIDLFETSDADIQVSLVPYGQYVNVGLDAASEPWVSIGATLSDKDGYWKTVNVVEGGTDPVCEPTGNLIPTYDVEDGVLVATGYRDEVTCTPGEPGTIVDSYQQWEDAWDHRFAFIGCMSSRPSPYDEQPEASSLNPIPAAMQITEERKGSDSWKIVDWDTHWAWVPCGQSVTPLTDDLNTIRSRISTLTTAGDTYLPAGLLWGWRTLDPRIPFDQSASRTGQVKNVLIFMTDGENSAYHTKYRGEYRHRPAYGESVSGDFSDRIAKARLGLDKASALCSRIKASNIEVYTIAYNLADGSLGIETRSMLRSCATSTMSAFTPNNPGELLTTFERIVQNMGSVRIVN